eukprot:c9848_g1_i1.p1 GENE.c9848_g1_i1~~c9848_g1_i1.p1  ORF type:complete len:343 (+),score=53.24 c9848_g1_i1:92-1030(+)
MNGFTHLAAAADIALSAEDPSPKVRAVLKGHLAKITSMQWAQDGIHLVSASHDSKLIVWNGSTMTKNVVPHRSAWIMACAIGRGGLVACGGLDKICSVYHLNAGTSEPKAKELRGHTGHLTCCRFVGQNHILTSSGDGTSCLWDHSHGKQVTVFEEHQSDVMSTSLLSEHTFVSASCDGTAKLWDLRSDKSICSFTGHTADINDVSAFPTGYGFATASDDGSLKFWDTRVQGCMQTMSTELSCGVTSVAFSLTGRYLFGGYDNYCATMWDVLFATSVASLQSHDGRVSCLSVPKDGLALCTGSWDSFLKIWI